MTSGRRKTVLWRKTFPGYRPRTKRSYNHKGEAVINELASYMLKPSSRCAHASGSYGLTRKDPARRRRTLVALTFECVEVRERGLQ